MYGIRQSKLDIFYDFIIQCLDSGWSKSKTIKEIYAKGYTCSKSNAFDYLCKIEQKENKYFEVQPYIRTMTEGLKYRTGSIEKLYLWSVSCGPGTSLLHKRVSKYF